MKVRLSFPTRWPRRFEAVLWLTNGSLEQRQLDSLANGESRVIYGDGVDVFKFEDMDSPFAKKTSWSSQLRVRYRCSSLHGHGGSCDDTEAKLKAQSKPKLKRSLAMLSQARPC